MDEEWKSLPLAQMEDVEALKRQYAIFSDETLKKWCSVITGPHRDAMEAVLRERRASS